MPAESVRYDTSPRIADKKRASILSETLFVQPWNLGQDKARSWYQNQKYSTWMFWLFIERSPDTEGRECISPESAWRLSGVRAIRDRARLPFSVGLRAGASEPRTSLSLGLLGELRRPTPGHVVFVNGLCFELPRRFVQHPRLDLGGQGNETYTYGVVALCIRKTVNAVVNMIRRELSPLFICHQCLGRCARDCRTYGCKNTAKALSDPFQDALLGR